MNSALPTLIMFVGLGAAFWFMSRSTKKQQQERQNTLNAMKPGDGVVTIGGLHGVLSEVNEAEKTVTIDCEGVYLVFDKAAIKTVKPGVMTTNDDTVTSVTTPATDETAPEATENQE